MLFAVLLKRYTEYDIIEKIINALQEIYAVGTIPHDENANVDTIIELDKELEVIGATVWLMKV